MKVLITLADVETAVRLNALLEADDIATALVSPMDDIAREIERDKPDLIVFTGGLAGSRNKTLIVNLPGSPSGVRDALSALDPIVAHACEVLRGTAVHGAGG